jgi:hypothetical protein
MGRLLGRLSCFFPVCRIADVTTCYMTKKIVKHAKETLGKLVGYPFSS